MVCLAKGYPHHTGGRLLAFFRGRKTTLVERVHVRPRSLAAFHGYTVALTLGQLGCQNLDVRFVGTEYLAGPRRKSTLPLSLSLSRPTRMFILLVARIGIAQHAHLVVRFFGGSAVFGGHFWPKGSDLESGIYTSVFWL